MRTLRTQLTLAFKADESRDVPASVILRVLDCASSVPIVDAELKPDEFVALLASASIEVDALVASAQRLQLVGKERVHQEHRPPVSVLNTSTDAPTADMIAYGDAYREHHGWDSATWHKHTDDSADPGWCLHLLRWEDRAHDA